MDDLKETQDIIDFQRWEKKTCKLHEKQKSNKKEDDNNVVNNPKPIEAQGICFDERNEMDNFLPKPSNNEFRKLKTELLNRKFKMSSKLNELSEMLEKQKNKCELKETAKPNEFEEYNIPANEPRLSSIFDIPTSDTNEPFTHDNTSFDISQVEVREMYLFSTFEEGNQVYLFCKYDADPTQFGTLCICVSNPSYFLYFLPSYNTKKADLENEVELIVNLCNGMIINKKWVSKKTMDMDENEYLEVEISSNCSIPDIPLKGKFYELVNGSSLSLTDNLYIHQHIKGPQWIKIVCSQSLNFQTAIPMFSAKTFDKIEPIKEKKEKPSFNICLFSFHSYNGSIFLLTMRILFQWDIENMCEYKDKSGAGHKIITYVCGSKIKECKDPVIFCQNEYELLECFLEKLDQYDIDLLASYDLFNNDLPFLISRIKELNIYQWNKFCRIFRNVFPSSIYSITAGRLLLDLKKASEILFDIKTDTFSELITKVIHLRRPIIDEEIAYESIKSNQRKFSILIGLNRKDTLLMKHLIQKNNYIVLANKLSRITGYHWSNIMHESTLNYIESFLLYSFEKEGFLIPDKTIALETFKNENLVNLKYPALIEDQTLLIHCDFFKAKIIKEKNICFTNHQNLKIKGFIPLLISKLIKSYEILCTRNEPNNDISKRSILQLLEKIPDYFHNGVGRFPTSLISKKIDTAIKDLFVNKKIIWYHGNSVIIQGNEFKSNKLSNMIVKHKFSKLLIPNEESYLGINENNQIINHKFPLYHYSWCNATKKLVDFVFTKSLCCNSPEDEIMKYIPKGFIQSLSNKDFILSTLIPKVKDESREFDSFIIEMESKGKIHYFDDYVEYLRCKSEKYKQINDVKKMDDIDIKWYIKNQFLPAISTILDSFPLISPTLIYNAFNVHFDETSHEELSFRCSFCFSLNSFNEINEDCFCCKKCGLMNNWKYVANSLTKCLRQFIFYNGKSQMIHCNSYLCNLKAQQIPLKNINHHPSPTNCYLFCKGTPELYFNQTKQYAVLKSFLMIFKNNKIKTKELKDFEEYMISIINSFIQNYGYSSIQFSSFESQSSDVYSFIEE